MDLNAGYILKVIRDNTFLLGLGIWTAATLSYFIFVSMDFPLPPIAENGLTSLLTMYIPVLILTVFLLLYLTGKRQAVAWTELYAVDKMTAKKESWYAAVYLLLTQLILGFGFNMGLHFPGTDVYSSGSHSQSDVWAWVISYIAIYSILPMMWLHQKGFSLKKLFASFNGNEIFGLLLPIGR